MVSEESIHADFLLVDVGNTSTKFALANRQGPIFPNSRDFATSLVDWETLPKMISGWHFEKCMLCSVVPAQNKFFESAIPPGKLFILDHHSALGVGVDYPHPETIGADRLANAAAVAVLHGTPAVVIDLGTAVTFDVVSAHRGYIGGVIAPGLGMMQHYLSARTALLPRIELTEPLHAIGKSTEEAMMAGAIYGYRGLIREILAQVRAELENEEQRLFGKVSALRVVATGGHANLIAKGLPEIEIVQSDLTLLGLRLILVNQEAQS